MRKLLILSVAALLAGCATGPGGAYQTPGDRLAAMRANVETRMINLYGYQAYAECRGRGLPLASNALMFCLDAHGPSPEAIARTEAKAAAQKPTPIPLTK